MFVLQDSIPSQDLPLLTPLQNSLDRVLRACSFAFLSVGLLPNLTTPVAAGSLEESFASNPLERGWIAVGDTNLFRWSAETQALDAIWDSSRPNSYFALPLGTTLSRDDSFAISFDLLLSEAVAGNDPQMPNPFQLALGLVHLDQAAKTNFMRGTGFSSPDLVEFSFFPDPGGAWQWGPSLMATLVDSTGANWSSGGFAAAGLEVNESYRVSLEFRSEDQSLRVTIIKGGQSLLEIQPATLDAKFTDLSVDHFAVCSYSGVGQDPSYSGSIYAVGKIDNVVITLPESGVGRIAAGYNGSEAEISFETSTDWTYLVQRSTDLVLWEPVGASVQGDGNLTRVTDAGAPSGRAYYRVVATRNQGGL